LQLCVAPWPALSTHCVHGWKRLGLPPDPYSAPSGEAVTWGRGLAAQSVAEIVKGYAKRAGFDPVLFAGHSLRAGFLTSAAKRGASIFKSFADARPSPKQKFSIIHILAGTFGSQTSIKRYLR
jgi:hypothetical protein